MGLDARTAAVGVAMHLEFVRVTLQSNDRRLRCEW